MTTEDFYREFGISKEAIDFGNDVLKSIEERFQAIDERAEMNQLKVIHAMQKNRVSESHLWGSTGYGYNDSGRDTLERVYADIFHCEDALVRSQITCGTHALTIALSGILRPGDELLSPVGKPYDTLEGIIGMEGTTTKGSLREFGISYRQVDLIGDSEFDYDGIREAINEKTKLVTIQRSKGYALRKTFSVEQIGELIKFIKSIKPDVICMVDNCYGEFVQTMEPTDVGADMCVGSLIKNPGGGLAPMGGYIVGKKEYVDLCAYRLTAPGLGKEVGASLQINTSFYQGLFLAPTVVASALKSAIFAANLYERLGFKASPGGDDERFDIIQAIAFESPERIISFCQGIQQAAPVDSFVLPEPYAMPGYHSDVIMAAGAFVQGSSIELSADAPIEPPYSVFFQGGITWPHGKLGILKTLQNMIDQGFVKMP
ncbi:MAG: methionine gamma-lyase family protein [Eubacterium sp.]|nr:methionine gamma-lyase family protein [Eubacterium sp.]